MTYDTINDAVTMPGGERMLAGRYRIVRQLGQGGMGSVWLVEDTLLDDKQFAVKMLPSILVSNKRAYKQLKDEALVAMKLTHPNIVTLRAFEENSGKPFLVMDYIDGQTLDDYLADSSVGRVVPNAPHGLPEADVIRLLKPVAAALDYAHAKGVVHRDVKPGNVMIAKDGTPYVLDFGIAREMQETMTRVTGKLSSGTLLYMSPEQLHGASPKKEQDIYSFAAMAYECLSGKPPFSRGQIEYQIDNDMPEPLVGRVVPNAPQSIACSVMSGLAKRPEDRPATCTAVLDGGGSSRAEHVERAEGGYGRARSPSAPQGGKSRLGKLIGVFALVAALAGGAWLYHHNLERQREQARIAAVQKAEDVKTLTLPGGATMEMIYVAPGSFTMGSPSSEGGRDDDETQHRVTLTKGYWLGKYEVTQAQWRSVMGGNPSRFKGDNRPVENVSWGDCQQFIRKVNEAARRQFGGDARLPTEAEWEYACRAGTTTSLSSGKNLRILGENNGPELDDIAWYGGNSSVGFELSNGYDCSGWPDKQYSGSRAGTHLVGEKSPNAWGFHDMHGNVWEWCQDWHGNYPGGSVTDPQGAASGDFRVFRGGSWDDDARDCRSASRNGSGPGYRDGNCGFRLCCSAGPRE